jgi:hypothetical protein
VTNAMTVQPEIVGAKEWLTVEEAAAALERSERSVQRLAQSGEVQFKVHEGRRLYRAADLHRAKSEGVPAARVDGPIPIADQAPGKQLVLPSRILGITRKIATEVSAQLIAARQAVTAKERLWLSLDEAHDLSGLAKSDLAVLAREGKIVARKSGGWKFRRASLEAFEG